MGSGRYKGDTALATDPILNGIPRWMGCARSW